MRSDLPAELRAWADLPDIRGTTQDLLRAAADELERLQAVVRECREAFVGRSGPIVKRLDEEIASWQPK